MLLIVICLLMENKSSSLKPTIEILTFQLNFFSEVVLMDLAIILENIENIFKWKCV